MDLHLRSSDGRDPVALRSTGSGRSTAAVGRTEDAAPSTAPAVVALDDPAVVALDDPAACRPELVGAKAANLAVAAAGRLPVLPGFVITTAASVLDLTRHPATAVLRNDAERRARQAWELLADGGAQPLVVRSSSPVEDAASSSMAGRFVSVLDVRGWDAFLDAVGAVLASAALDDGAPAAPMAVLVQPLLEATTGGVLFGVDPVSGSARHLTVEAVAGGPDALVSGRATAVRYVVSRRGRIVEADAEPGERLLDGRRSRQLAALAGRAAETFGGPQDIEWAFDGAGQPWMLQSRPITATGETASARGPLLGPGPVAETFPDPLTPLEVDLWVEPLRAGITEALKVTGTASRRRLGSSPVVAVVGGQVAADLELLGVQTRKRSLLRKLDPRPPARRLGAAWRVGRLRAALPALIGDLVGQVDLDLRGVPPLAELTDSALIGVLARTRRTLVAVHGNEVLAGMLLPPPSGAPTGAAVALDAVARGRAAGLTDAQVLARMPQALGLLPPALAGTRELPVVPPAATPLAAGGGAATARLEPREALRLRARWVQELSARCARELGCRLAARGVLADAADIRSLHLVELGGLVAGEPLPADLPARLRELHGAPLPAMFRLSAAGSVVAATPPAGNGSGGGRGAGGGRAIGTVAHDVVPGAVEPGTVLVVRTLDPALAAALPGLTGLVAETGSVLSHLAILARELGVPTVVAVPDALDRFPAGSVVTLDGATGEVDLAAVEVQR